MAAAAATKTIKIPITSTKLPHLVLGELTMVTAATTTKMTIKTILIPCILY